jgi:hypothetical protein
LAALLLDHKVSERYVSNVFGSAGNKRQRRIEAAVQHLGLAEALVHPRIERPVYALALASNAEDVALLNVRPSWLVEPRLRPGAYAERAVRTWRERWRPVVARRLAEDGEYITGLREWLVGRAPRDEPC